MNKKYILVVLLATSLLGYPLWGQGIEASLIPKKGLWIKSQGLPWGMGSEINFLDADRKHHEYYFTWWEQDADTNRADKDILFIGSKNTAVDGNFILTKKLNNLDLTLDCSWNKSIEGVCDILYLKIWTPYFKNARWLNKKGEDITLQLQHYSDTFLVAKTPFGDFEFNASIPFQLRKDEHLHLKENDFSARSQFLYLEEKNIKLQPNEKLVRKLTIKKIQSTQISRIDATDTVLTNPFHPIDVAWEAVTGNMALLPRPTQWKKEENELIIPISPKKNNDSLVAIFNTAVKKYWQAPGYLNPIIRAHVDNNLSPEAYTIDISTSIQITYGGRQGLQYAIESLGQLVYQKNGLLVINTGQLSDQPKIDWRGIHMFTGPASWPLHKKMFDNVLLPLKMNKTVIQCEQAEWKSMPNVHNAISIGLDDLKNEFTYLRTKQVEPIPLIQSLGHMEWFFKPTANRKLAINPSYPYTLNVFKPEAVSAIHKIWDEAIQLLKPTTIHAGFDEIGMIGFNWPREKEIELFQQQINWLDHYTKKNKLSLMIWGDMGLAPGEGPDACNGINESRAAQIRKLIPAKTWVADWHYLGNPDPSVYQNNILIWKKEGLKPVASPWFIGNNIRGFTLAAIEQNIGVLQTTWADFESSESNMLKNIEQFGAYVLALDYAWSGRQEMPHTLPYEPIQEFTNRFYRQPLPLGSAKGWTWKGHLQLNNLTDSTKNNLSNIRFNFREAKSIKGIKMNTSCQVILPEATPIAILELWEKNSLVFQTRLLYGRDSRAKQDPRPIFKRVVEKNKEDWYNFWNSPVKIDTIKIKLIHPAAGLLINELTLIE